jgi:hypothetical protein
MTARGAKCLPSRSSQDLKELRESSQFGVDLSSLLPNCFAFLRVSVVRVGFAFPISAMLCDDGDLGDRWIMRPAASLCLRFVRDTTNLKFTQRKRRRPRIGKAGQGEIRKRGTFWEISAKCQFGGHGRILTRNQTDLPLTFNHHFVFGFPLTESCTKWRPWGKQCYESGL